MQEVHILAPFCTLPQQEHQHIANKPELYLDEFSLPIYKKNFLINRLLLLWITQSREGRTSEGLEQYFSQNSSGCPDNEVFHHANYAADPRKTAMQIYINPA